MSIHFRSGLLGVSSLNMQKIPVAILGATGSVGQKFVQLLSNHPWFDIVAIAASERSEGKSYREAARWILADELPSRVAGMPVQACEPNLGCRIVFSGLDSRVAGEIEERFARAGYIVVSNAKNHRWDPKVPLLVPEVNGEHVEMIRTQPYGKGAIVTNPNCSTTGLVLALKPLLDRFGLEAVSVVTMQALSGAGYPGVASLDIVDNVIPFIAGEEEKVQTEPLKILGLKHLIISAQCNRVAVLDGHTECVSIKLSNHAEPAEIIAAWESFSAEPQRLQLPMAPEKPIYYFTECNYPQPRIHRNLDKGMAVSIGRLRKCELLDYKFVLLSHNTIRGAAGGAILNAELMVKKGFINHL
jgi:aspartate-semialdehyde dehydrogenase